MINGINNAWMSPSNETGKNIKKESIEAALDNLWAPVLEFIDKNETFLNA